MVSGPFQECQICELQLVYHSPEEYSRQSQGWAIHAFHHEGGVATITTCPQCATMTPENLVAAFTRRVRAGRDLKFH